MTTRVRRYAYGAVGIVFVALAAFWSHYEFFLPHYHTDASGDLISGETVLVPVSSANGPISGGVQIPDGPMWDAIGYADGANRGTLYRFTYDGRTYVADFLSGEMMPVFVYRYGRLSDISSAARTRAQKNAWP